MMGIEISAWLAAGYGVVLVLIAYGIDLLAKRANTSLAQQQAPGFVYHEDHDAWQCPEDQWLWPKSFDPDNRVMRYRGSPTVCNACPVKDTCTTSSDGREMRRAVDSWPASESARFHRGIACSVTVLALLWPLISAFTVAEWASQLLLLVASAVVVAASVPLWLHLRRTPADPHGVLVQTLDDNLTERTTAGADFVRRRTTYASDRREASDA